MVRGSDVMVRRSDAARKDARSEDVGTQDVADAAEDASCASTSLTRCAAVCTDVSSDTHNCGGCGHDAGR